VISNRQGDRTALANIECGNTATAIRLAPAREILPRSVDEPKADRRLASLPPIDNRAGMVSG